jgi:hypothetical protein
MVHIEQVGKALKAASTALPPPAKAREGLTIGERTMNDSTLAAIHHS